MIARLTIDRSASNLRRMSTILLTNDDGIQAPGLQALYEELSTLGETWVIAPHEEKSACGRSVTLSRPLRVSELSKRRLSVDGTPADCVLLAFRSILEEPPKIVVSGINHGFNVGEDLDYSGTVAAAAEAALQGAQISVAVSTDSKSDSSSLANSAKFTRALIEQLLEHPPPKGSYLNVNLPINQTKRIRWTRQGNPLGRGQVIVGNDPRGKQYYWIAERPKEDKPPADTDRGAIEDGCISLSVLTLDRNWQGDWTPPSLWSAGYSEEMP